MWHIHAHTSPQLLPPGCLFCLCVAYPQLTSTYVVIMRLIGAMHASRPDAIIARRDSIVVCDADDCTLDAGGKTWSKSDFDGGHCCTCLNIFIVCGISHIARPTTDRWNGTQIGTIVLGFLETHVCLPVGRCNGLLIWSRRAVQQREDCDVYGGHLIASSFQTEPSIVYGSQGRYTPCRVLDFKEHVMHAYITNCCRISTAAKFDQFAIERTRLQIETTSKLTATTVQRCDVSGSRPMHWRNVVLALHIRHNQPMIEVPVQTDSVGPLNALSANSNT